MSNLGAWLLAMMAPLAGRLLVALGFQVVTITGMAASITAVKNLFLSHMSSVPAAGFQLALLAGVGEAFGMIFGAIAFRVLLWNIQSSTKILGVNS